ncbi:hypothetical protein PHMEG_000743 [Phytophthora megakarya]|uniref:G domain-containing protein n=1 Tax=Phytophthora megakarya TaxID=4795 RepID=A0A225X2A9_9STRA|nr:hypothetical protein PHMEG_000743 [Phytophthora megakarya]
MSGGIRESRLFLGNPGTGKSTLINCLVGKQAFRSGVSWGGGLTQEYQRIQHNDIAYMDTPGLADQTIITKAAEAITTALRQHGVYKLFFMVRINNGRVVSEDITTIERVLDSIDFHGNRALYSVVINNISKKQFEKLKNRGYEFEQVTSVINSRKYPATAFCLIPKIDELDEESGKVVQLPHEIRYFIENEAPTIRIEANNVKDINLQDFEQQTQQILVIGISSSSTSSVTQRATTH